MQPFYLFITLSALTSPSAWFVGPKVQFKDMAACERALPRAERALQQIIISDPSSLKFFGTVIGKVTYGHFIQYGECVDGEAGT